MNFLRKIPAALERWLQDTAIQEVNEGQSGTHVFHLDKPGQPDYYLKIATRGSAQDMYPEVSRLIWLKGRLPVPDVLYWGEDSTQQYLLISALGGLALYDESIRDQLPELIRLYALALQQIHRIPADTCPFDMRLDVKIAQAAQHFQEDLVDTMNFDPERQGRTAQSLFREVLATRPGDEDLVFTHGDYCTPNVLIDPDTMTLSGLIDWGRAGVSDRYQDLALAARSIDYNFGAAWIKPFFDAYGVAQVDSAKVDFYKLLDEFF